MSYLDLPDQQPLAQNAPITAFGKQGWHLPEEQLSQACPHQERRAVLKMADPPGRPSTDRCKQDQVD